MILDKIVKVKQRQISKEFENISVEGLKRQISGMKNKSGRNFYSAIKDFDDISIIGEVKKASPSKGIIRKDFNPVKIAGEYEKANVQALSVLTEKNFFKGSDDYLARIRQHTNLPLLRKDFLIDIRQVYQSKLLGADAVLLIVSVLSEKKLKEFVHISRELNMACLVEVHNKSELERALSAGSDIIGINNRNLKTFDVNLDVTERLIKHIPEDKAVVSESGIKTSRDMSFLKQLGVDAVLIGETFMRAACIKDKADRLRSDETLSKKVKTCPM